VEVVSIGTPTLWIGFTVLVLGLLALDLGVFHRDAHEVSFREALGWSVVWVSLALAFNGWLAWQHGSERGLEFLTGYLIEKALAVDNIFVILLSSRPSRCRARTSTACSSGASSARSSCAPRSSSPARRSSSASTGSCTCSAASSS
jgi:hypothetical protein